MEIDENAFSLSQSCLDFNDGSDSVGAVRVRNGGVLVDGIVTEHKHLLAIEGVFRPSDVRQQTRGCGTIRIVGVLIVDEVDWCDPRQSPRSHKREKGGWTYLWHPCQGGHLGYRTSQEGHHREQTQGRVRPCHVSTLDQKGHRLVRFHPGVNTV